MTIQSKIIDRQLAFTKAEAKSISAEYARCEEWMARLKAEDGKTPVRAWKADFDRFSRHVDKVEARFQKLKSTLDRIRAKVLTLADSKEITTEDATTFTSDIAVLLDGSHRLKGTTE